MSTETKESLDSPKSSLKAKNRTKIALKKGTKQTRNSTQCFDLGVAMKESIRDEDIKRIMSLQKKSLKNIAKTNELLGKFNDFSSSKYDVLQHMFLQHTQLLVDLKKGLTNVFLRIRCLKVRLQQQYPTAFEATFNLRQDLEDRLEQEEEDEPTYTNTMKDKGVNKNEKSTKNENETVDESAVGNKNESLQAENENSELSDEEEKENSDFNLEINCKIDAIDKTEFVEKMENCVRHDNDYMCKESKEVAEDGMPCGNDSQQTDVMENKTAQDNDYIHKEVKNIEKVPDGSQGKDNEEAQGIKVVTEGVKDCLVIERSTEHITDSR